MKTIKRVSVVALCIIIIFSVTGCSSSPIKDGQYYKGDTEFPNLTVEGNSFTIRQDAKTKYSFSVEPNDDGEYIYILDDYMELVIKKKNNKKVSVNVTKRVKNFLSSLDTINYKSMKGTYTLDK